MRTDSGARERGDGPLADAEDPLWITAETAAYLRRPVGTLRQWRHRGYGPQGFRVGGIVMYRRSEVMRWLQEQERAEANRNSIE